VVPTSSASTTRPPITIPTAPLVGDRSAVHHHAFFVAPPGDDNDDDDEEDCRSTPRAALSSSTTLHGAAPVAGGGTKGAPSSSSAAGIKLLFIFELRDQASARSSVRAVELQLWLPFSLSM
jgi:hypothetical protein